MRKNLLLLLFASIILISPVRADEGMWLLPLIKKLNIKQMDKIGFKLSAKDIYDINNASLKDAVIHFGGGCTGEIISAEGLLLTNHHCGYSHIQKLSSVEHDYLQDGFWAMNREQEIPAPGLTVTFLESFTDVTPELEKATKGAKTPEERAKLYNEATKALIDKATKNNKYVSATITDMYGGNSYYLVVTKTYSDIRFVGAPPSSIGKFGADTDNWVWPRHTGDFSLFRIYADTDNNPASYSPSNKPYTPKRHLTISIAGIEHGTPAMIIGYPGRTSRFMTSAEVENQRNITNRIMIDVRGVRQAAMMEEMVADPKVRLQYASKYASSSNFWKKAKGMNETFDKLNVIERRAQAEAEFTKWVNQDKKRVEKYGDALEKINSSILENKDVQYKMGFIREALGNVELATFAGSFGNLAAAVKEGNNERIAQTKALMKERTAPFYKDYSPSTDRKVAKALIKIYRDNIDPKDRPSIFEIIEKEFNGSIDKYVDDMFDRSIFTSPEKLEKALNENLEAIVKDPALIFSQSTAPLSMQYYSKLFANRDKYAAGHKAYIAGQLEMRKGEAIYPDANSTMRMTYGQVLDYSPRDAVNYDFITTLEGVMEKEDPTNWEFVVPSKLKELYKAKDFGRYALKDGRMPVCFLSNNDITGGNSGSPVLNGKGELIGCAFDGNWEAMSGDIIFEPNVQRCINVDIRYVLFIIEKFGGARHLIDEMTIVEK